MHAFLLLLALISSCHGRPLDEEQHTGAQNEDKKRNERGVADTTQELEPWEESEIAAALEGSHNPAQKIPAKISSEREDNQEKGGFWNTIKKAASFVAKSAKEGLAKLNRQMSSFLGVSRTMTVTITTPAHSIKRKSVDEIEEQNKLKSDMKETDRELEEGLEKKRAKIELFTTKTN